MIWWKPKLDVTLVSDDKKQIQAHKFVLSACSPMLKNLLVKNVHPQPLIYMRGVGQEQLGYILQFMYQGEVSLGQDKVEMFLLHIDLWNILRIQLNFRYGTREGTSPFRPSTARGGRCSESPWCPPSPSAWFNRPDSETGFCIIRFWSHKAKIDNCDENGHYILQEKKM